MIGGTVRNRHGRLVPRTWGFRGRWKTQWKDRRLFVVFWLVRGLVYPLTILGMARWFEGANCRAVSMEAVLRVSVSEPGLQLIEGYIRAAQCTFC